MSRRRRDTPDDVIREAARRGLAVYSPDETDDPRPDLMLVISIGRPTPKSPDGYMCMSAHARTGSKDKPLELFEDAANGPINARTEKALIADIRSYIANGRKAFANRTKADQPQGRDR
jgi:hypothetical protein